MTEICNCGSARCMKAGIDELPYMAFRVPLALSVERGSYGPLMALSRWSARQPTCTDNGADRVDAHVRYGRGIARRGWRDRRTRSKEAIGRIGVSKAPRRRCQARYQQAGGRARIRLKLPARIPSFEKALRRPEQRRGNVPNHGHRAILAIVQRLRHQVSLACSG